MTSAEAWRWCAHHWAWGLLRLVVVYAEATVTGFRALYRMQIIR